MAMNTHDRSAINTALAKAIAYVDCGKPEKAEAWAVRLMCLLHQADLLQHSTILRANEALKGI
jgi:hypothetical protein